MTFMSSVRVDKRVDEIVAQRRRPLSSFEFFPPKTDEGVRRLIDTVEELAYLEPGFVSVTYGANGSSRQFTLDATLQIKAHTDAAVVGHLTCTGQSVDELKRVIDSYAQAGITSILAVRGDMPGGASVPWEPHPHGLRNATELVELIASQGDFCIGVGAFPDGHTGSTPQLDATILKNKADAGASFAITQLFFDSKKYSDLVTRAHEAGCDIPIIPGIMPVTNVKQLGKFAELSGADVPSSVAQRLLHAPDDPDEVRRVGSQIAAELCDDLLKAGSPGLHFFTQNRSLATREILAIASAHRRG